MVRTDFFKLGHLSKGFEQNASVVEFVTRVSGIQETGIEKASLGLKAIGLVLRSLCWRSIFFATR